MRFSWVSLFSLMIISATISTSSFCAPTGFSFFKNNMLSVNYLFTAGSLPANLTLTRASSGTCFNSSGTLVSFAANTPRFCYDPVTLSNLGLLVEGSRMNLNDSSEDIENWPTLAAAVTPNVVTAPDGNLTGDRVYDDATTNSHNVQSTAMAPFLGQNTNFVVSFFAKPAGKTWVIMRMSNWANSRRNLWVNMSGAGSIGATTSTTSQGVKLLANGWYYIWGSTSSGAGATNPFISIGPTTNDAVFSYAGTGAAGIYLWGVQTEIGSYPTSYFKSTVAPATREADIVTMSPSGWLNTLAGTFLIKASMNIMKNGTRSLLDVNDTTASNRLRVEYNTTNDVPILDVTSGGASVATTVPGGPFTVETPTNIVMGYSAAATKAQITGGTLTSGVAASPLPALKSLRLGARFDDSNPFNGYFQSLVYYNTLKTDAEITALTVTTPTLIQHNANNAATNTVNATFTLPVTGGNLLVACMSVDFTATSLAVSDTKGNTWTQIATKGTSTNGQAACYYATNVAAGTTAVTAAASGTSVTILSIFELSNVTTLDKFGTNNGTGGTPSVATSSGLAANSTDYVMAYAMDWNSYCTWGAGAGYTVQEQADLSGGKYIAATVEQTAKTGLSGVQTATFTKSPTTNNWNAIIMAFK
jgi:hypothetical protein